MCAIYIPKLYENKHVYTLFMGCTLYSKVIGEQRLICTFNSWVPLE